MKGMPRNRHWMHQVVKGVVIIALVVSLAAFAGCATGDGAAPTDPAGDRWDTDGGVDNGRMEMQNARGEGRGMGIRSHQAGQDEKRTDKGKDGVITLSRRDGELYVPVRELVEMLDFKSNYDPETGMFRIGDNDVAYELKAGSVEASRHGDPVRLDKPAMSINGELHAPLAVIEKLFAEAMEYEVDGDKLRLKPQEEPADDAGLPDFKDDPYDPFTNQSGANESSGRAEELPVDAKLKNIDVNALIKTAHKYIGVPYVFGAKPYPQSKVFDCSSYVQYVYGKYGVDLPRSSRKQATVGKPVSRDNLRKGDLLFFYLPGRYKSNKIVGHVGIYIGNGKMIHSSNKPKDGVQVTSINKSFWKKTYLSARRVVQ